MVKKDKTDILNQIIYVNYLENLKKYKNNSRDAIRSTIYNIRYLLTNKNYLGFTRTDRSRAIIEESFEDPTEFIDTIVNSYVKKLFAERPRAPQEEDLYIAALETYNKYGIEQVKGAIKKVILENDYGRFTRSSTILSDKNFRKTLMKNVTSEDMKLIIGTKIVGDAIRDINKKYSEKYQKVEQKINRQYGKRISNFTVNANTYNLCRDDILKGKQFEYNKMDYKVGKDLYASTDVGNVRQNQEDSVIILQHPENPDFKMLVVADGAGGSARGEVASSYITRDITQWFESLPSQYYDSRNIIELQRELNKRLAKINDILYSKYRSSAYSTFVGALVTDKQTVVTNVGDSRAYIYANGKLNQITKDDNVSYMLWESNYNIGDDGQKIPDKDAIRYHKNSNQITQAIGAEDEICANSIIISNNSYQTLMLFSDGITDCLSDKQIMAITKYTPKDVLSRSLIENAKACESGRSDLDPRYFNQFIKAGKDNATVAILDKREEDER